MSATTLEPVRKGIAALHRDRPDLEVDVWLPAIDAYLIAHAQMVEKVREVIAAHRYEASLLAHDPESRDYLNEQADKLAAAIGVANGLTAPFIGNHGEILGSSAPQPSARA